MNAPAYTPEPGAHLLKLADVKQMVGISHQTVYRWASDGRFPRPIKVGRQVRWRPDEVAAWIASRSPSTCHVVAAEPKGRAVKITLPDQVRTTLQAAATARGRKGLALFVRRLVTVTVEAGLIDAVLDDGARS